MKRPVKAASTGGRLQFFINVNFAARDGSDGEVGSRQVMVPWTSLLIVQGTEARASFLQDFIVAVALS